MQGEDAALLPHPVAAPVALPCRQAAAAELQIEPVLAVEEAAAADVAERKEGFVAGAAADPGQWCAQRVGGLLLVHTEGQRRSVRQGCDKGRRKRRRALPEEGLRIREVERGDGQAGNQ